jgi:hypothetical protein
LPSTFVVASSALISKAYVYALVGGSGAGMDCGPFAPTVYSVRRRLREVTGVVAPDG